MGMSPKLFIHIQLGTPGPFGKRAVGLELKGLLVKKYIYNSYAFLFNFKLIAMETQFQDLVRNKNC